MRKVKTKEFSQEKIKIFDESSKVFLPIWPRIVNFPVDRDLKSLLVLQYS